ncbi:hypothetical protein [Altererythrobacter sp. Root672]|uniref:hypothetical protein n=1 Tax=Altererythrobacter sp. Root672 TaxID=1736584 RepID=UPI0006F7F147|nr:hypothetical protein [Altererythrobacter sp. Root672]KRA84371.1 hypothetical protein ASD76_10440 [Altererythrobacter sp. Root672]
MQDKIHGFLPATEEMPTDRQRLIVHYLCGVLIDLVVLNLFDEFWDSVHVASFSWSLLAAVLMQAFLKGTNAIVHHLAVFFSARQGALMKVLRVFTAWLVLFLSKFVILEAIDMVFGDKVRFEGAMDGLLPLMVVVTVMVIAEEAVVRFVRWVR